MTKATTIISPPRLRSAVMDAYRANRAADAWMTEERAPTAPAATTEQKS